MKWWQIGLIVLAVIGAAVGIYVISSKPIPGEKKEEQGREHVSPEEVAKFSYNSNPPTSGPHLPTWVKAGIFDTPQSEGELIHSLEHGYVIISYNCNVHLSTNAEFRMPNVKYSSFSIQHSFISRVYAHEEDAKETSPSADFVDPTISTASPSPEFKVNAINETQACKDLIKQLSDVANANRLWKLAVVPRPQLDTTIALTAWGYIDKFDPPAGGFDASRIKGFIDYHRDQGPEKTME